VTIVAPVSDPPRLLSVVIPTLNCADTLGEQLEALANQTYAGPWEVVIADNGSTDGSREIAEQWAEKLPELRVVDASDRKGVSRARNVGAAAARGDFILLCDADDVATPRWLEAMADAGRRFDVVGGYLDPEPLNDSLTQAWRPGFPRHELPDALGFLPFAVGANCGVRASVFREFNGWREDYVGGGDDVEFSWRAHLASYRVGFAPDAVIHYRYRRGLRALARQYYWYGLGEPRLYRDFRPVGAPRSGVVDGLLWWARLVRHLPDLARPDSRGNWIRRAAYGWGRLRGSVRYRAMFL
jgi:glycosyltransferase involved in cell wall biosynthesis